VTGIGRQNQIRNFLKEDFTVNLAICFQKERFPWKWPYHIFDLAHSGQDLKRQWYCQEMMFLFGATIIQIAGALQYMKRDGKKYKMRFGHNPKTPLYRLIFNLELIGADFLH